MNARGLVLASAVAASAFVSPAATATAATSPVTVTFSFVGDTILGNTPRVPAHPARYLSPVAGAVHTGVDAAFGNLEGTLTTTGTSKCGAGSSPSCFAFRNPPSFARAYAATGFAVLGLANNHSHDYGDTGLRSTTSAIRGAGMHATGLPGQITYIARHGVRIAFVAFAPYYATNNLLDLSGSARLIHTARQHARIVVVYMHAGAEGSAADHVTGGEEYYVGEDRGNPRRFAHLAIDNGASLVVASGPHVLRGMEFYRGRLVAYSLGDFANYHNFSTSGSLRRSAVLRVTLTARGAFVQARLVSVTLTSTGQARVGGDSVPFVASLSRQDFGAAAPVFSRSGVIRRR